MYEDILWRKYWSNEGSNEKAKKDWMKYKEKWINKSDPVINKPIITLKRIQQTPYILWYSVILSSMIRRHKFELVPLNISAGYTSW